MQTLMLEQADCRCGYCNTYEDNLANKVVKPFLTEHQQLKFQRRLSHYLKDYEYKNNVYAKDVAEKIDISPQKFSYIKSDKIPYPKFVNSLDYLAKLANLKQMSVAEFVKYLEGDQDTDEEIESERKRSNWEKLLIASFEPLTSKNRLKLIELCKESLRDGKRKLEALIEIINVLQNKDVEAIESLRDSLKKLT